MNVIVICLDSFRWDHIGVYHRGRGAFPNVPACRTPNLDRFAEQCVIFENAYPEALPTMPVRLALMTGQRTLHCRSWEPLKENDVPIQRILGEQGYVSGLVSDTYHFRAPGMNYHAGFNCYRWVRGQEYDPWVSSPTKRNVDDYVNAKFTDVWRKRVEQFLANTDSFAKEEDWFAAKVMREACDWLRANRCHKKVLLWIDSFDPHEPWDPPARWDTYTDPNYKGKRLILPMGGMAREWATAEEQRHMQGLYAGEAASVDHCFGQLLECLELEGYMEDSLIVLLADHGHPLGDHGKFLKGTDRMYSELLKRPFLMHLPGAENGGMHTDALVQCHDLLPTILDLLGQQDNLDGLHGRSFVPVLKGYTDKHRPAIITGYNLPVYFGRSVERCIRDARWSYVSRLDGEPDELFDLAEDPRETCNLIDEHPDEARRLSAMFGSRFRSGVVRRVKGAQGVYEMGSASIG